MPQHCPATHRCLCFHSLPDHLHDGPLALRQIKLLRCAQKLRHIRTVWDAAIHRRQGLFPFKAWSMLRRRSCLHRFLLCLDLCVLNGMQELFQSTLPVFIPVQNMHPIQLPPKSTQHRRLKQIPIPGGGSGEDLLIFAEDPQQVAVRSVRIDDTHIHLIGRAANAATGLESTLLQGSGNLPGKGIVRFHMLCTHRQCPGAPGCKLQKAPQSSDAVGTGTGQVNLLRRNDRVHLHLPTGTGYCHVQPPPASIPVHRAEIHGHLSVLVWTIADGKQDHVPLIPLYILQILHQDRLVHLLRIGFQLGLLSECLRQQIINQHLLHHTEGHYANALPAQLFIRQPPQDLRHNGFRLCPVLLGTALVIEALHMMPLYPGHQVIRGGEGKQLVFIESGVAECDQALVTGAVMPQQVPLGHSQCQTVIQHAFQILLLVVFLVHLVGGKEAGRR